ncbi:unnamed protein product, partial [Allacma fusca]
TGNRENTEVKILDE